jgi:hypothetical protein
MTIRLASVASHTEMEKQMAVRGEKRCDYTAAMGASPTLRIPEPAEGVKKFILSTPAE